MTAEVRRTGPVVVVVFSHRDPPQVQRLVDRLAAGDDVFVAVHHDPQGPSLSLRPASNVALIPGARHCPWGRSEMADAMVRTLGWVAQQAPELSWALLVSGQDYPAMPVTEMERELRATPHDAFLRHFRIDDDPALDVHHWQALTRRRYLHSRRLPGSARGVPWPRRHPFTGGRHAYAGDVWYNLGAEAVRHAIGNAGWARELLAYCRSVPNPDELVIPSLVLNGDPHPPALDVVSERRRYVRFGRGSPHPETLSVADVDAITASDAFFARKVRPDDTALMDALDAAAADRSKGR